MKTKLTLLILLFGFFASGQTRIETQAWIKEKIELYSFSNDVDIFNEYLVEYEGEDMIITNKSGVKLKGGVELQSTWVHRIPIKELAKVRFEDKAHNIWLYLKIKGGKKLIHTEVYSDELPTRTSEDNEVQILLRKSVKEDDLRNRLSKAFNHLVKAYGGVVIDETF